MGEEMNSKQRENIRAAVNEYREGKSTLKLIPGRGGFDIVPESNDPSYYHANNPGVREITIAEAKKLKDETGCVNRKTITVFLEILEEIHV
jgi:hypothetical protein